MRRNDRFVTEAVEMQMSCLRCDSGTVRLVPPTLRDVVERLRAIIERWRCGECGGHNDVDWAAIKGWDKQYKELLS